MIVFVLGLARSGNVYDLDIDEKILVKAFNNTVEMLKKKHYCGGIKNE